MNGANILTFSRIALLPVFAYLVFSGHNILATILLIIAALTDAFDGWWARKFKQESDLGRLMDPVSDKIFLASALVFFVADTQRALSPWLAALLIAREFLISGLRAYWASKGSVVSAKPLAKLKTVFQFVGLGALAYLESFPWIGITGLQLGNVCLWISFVLSYWTLIDYIQNARKAV